MVGRSILDFQDGVMRYLEGMFGDFGYKFFYRSNLFSNCKNWPPTVSGRWLLNFFCILL